jgi:hypothetical protein
MMLISTHSWRERADDDNLDDAESQQLANYGPISQVTYMKFQLFKNGCQL